MKYYIYLNYINYNLFNNAKCKKYNFQRLFPNLEIEKLLNMQFT